MNRLFASGVLFGALLVGLPQALADAQQDLDYHLKTDQVFGGEVTIEAGRESYAHSMKGHAIDSVLTGYWEWFRKDGVIMRQDILTAVSRWASGRLSINTGTSTS